MKTTKLVIGILSIILSLIILFQSCAAGLVNSVAQNNKSDGTGGMILAVCFLVAGITAVATRKPKSKGGYVAGGFYVAGGLIAFASAGIFKDLYVWGTLAIAFGLVFIIGDYLSNKKQIALEKERQKKKSKKKSSKSKRKKRH